MIPPDKQNEIRQRLCAAESEHDVQVLLAVESGSRAWGFASPNSDYDGRFIYVNRPEWYLSVTLEEQRDVIEYPITDDMDINGWDLRKALRLFLKSNPGFVEWLQSPIVYQSTGSLRSLCTEVLPQVYSIERGVYHYRSMAKTNFRSYLQEQQVPLKKYFYVLRPLLAVRWLVRQRRPAPIEFSTLMQMAEGEPGLVAAINDLLELKRSSLEMGLSPQVPAIQGFIAAELERQERLVIGHDGHEHAGELLNGVFRRLLTEAWG